MNVTIRKLVVGLLALAALIGVYLLYTRANRIPSSAADLAKTVPAPVADVNMNSLNDVGTILDVGIGRIEQTRFLHRNEQNQIDRDFGFVQLLHKQGTQWEITNPYMKLFLPTFQCVVTANRGKVQVDTAFSRPVAGDAMFSGNVVIHIIPAEPNDALECFIHLDDVGFLAASSLFSTAGPVRFLSRRAQLTGTGMELLYDEARSRLELFRIFHLDSLRFKSREVGSVADLTPRRRPPEASPSSPGSSAGLPDGQALNKPTAGGPGPTAAPADCYQCFFHRNVVIDMPDRVITSRDVLALDNILWSGSKKAATSARRPVDPNDPNAVPYPGPNALVTTASSHAAISSIPPEFFDTLVTCDGGLVVTPMGSGRKIEDTGQKTQDNAVLRPPSSGAPDRQYATAQRIHFNAFTTDTTLTGPVEMSFPLDPNSFGGAKAAAKAMPMTVTAQKDVRFLAATSQVLFEGDCRVTLLRSEPNLTYEYVLTAPQLTLDIVTDPNGAKGQTADAKRDPTRSEPPVTARRLVTDGGPAALRILRRGPHKLLGWTTLDAAQLQYEANPRQFTAVGPGKIWIRNDETINAKADPNQFSLGRPCIACLSNFDTLKYFAGANHIIAEDEAQQLLLDYFPLVDGKYARHTWAVVGYVEASLKEVTKGHLELATLTATKGIEYEDETEGLSFVGSTLSYDSSQSLVAIRGDNEQRCYLNDALVDQIDLNLKTGRIQADFPAPSVFQVRQ